ncbi:uncharacterized protein NP_0450A [Natronomonas pharaonis DSM 2160]|uniref:Uncharacterized protein n=1 Tax=Natronomonas pharaonis (strain ATCC 35678 / DSM 2160 / CIP 103997 / JCM 8858 / NBRC 14720 / NCIMB 2260 / Gabara) TaxID=348780 RepID=A0A1U7ETS5_NATPD|nr:hypothetical protein [Natronomonas pharaonis]CAI48316.1 uncharacterized protein NP_0450A [Natronomonas pharaonis DSM 2160]
MADETQQNEGVLGALRRPASNGELRNPKIAAAAVLLLVLLPLIPFFVVVWRISKTLRGVRKRVSWE